MAMSELMVFEKLFHEDQPIGGRVAFAVEGCPLWASACAALHKTTNMVFPARESVLPPSNMNPSLLQIPVFFGQIRT